jgi:putative ABC transport system ATP-binding protein
MSALIQMENMYKFYKLGGETITALKDVSLTVEEGDFVSIIGPSGSGKSTFMNIIGCLDKGDRGTYYLGGKEVNSLNDRELAVIRNKKIGFIFQNFHLLAKLTALENVELPLLYRGVDAKLRKKMALESLEKVGLKDRASHYPNQLSGGQQQRVAIARALAGNPPLLLADEPTGALDSKTSSEILGILTDLNRRGHTILVITHDHNVARQGKRIVHIKDGELTSDERLFEGLETETVMGGGESHEAIATFQNFTPEHTR